MNKTNNDQAGEKKTNLYKQYNLYNFFLKIKLKFFLKKICNEKGQLKNKNTWEKKSNNLTKMSWNILFSTYNVQK